MLNERLVNELRAANMVMLTNAMHDRYPRCDICRAGCAFWQDDYTGQCYCEAHSEGPDAERKWTGSVVRRWPQCDAELALYRAARRFLDEWAKSL